MSDRNLSPTTPPSTPPSVEEFESDWSESDAVPNGPAYSAQELVEIFIDFYNFLKTVHFQDVTLKVPPPGGWPNIVESIASPKPDRVCEVIRHLPYFDDAPEALLHFNSRLLDYTRMSLEDVEGQFSVMGDVLEGWHYSLRRDMEIDASNTFPFSLGYGAGGKAMYLNVWDGEVSEANLLTDMGEPVEIKSYFGKLREHFETLRLIPCYNRIVIEAENVLEHTGIISEGQVVTQPEEWGTELDIQYIRQLYRGFGWPSAFRKDATIQAVDQLMEKVKDKRGEWEFIVYEFQEGIGYS